MTRPGCRARRGISLIEVLVYILIAGSVTGTFTLVMHRILRAGAESREAHNRAAQLDRLALDLVADVQAAGSVEQRETAQAGEPELLLELPGPRQVRYRWHAPWMVRQEERDGRLQQQEAYWLGGDVQQQWHVAPDPLRVDLLLRRRGNQPGSGVVLRRIEAYASQVLAPHEELDP